MSQAKKMIIRVQSPEGTARVEMSPTECTAALYERVREQLALSSFEFALYRDRARTEALPSSRSRSLAAARLAHGDLLYLSAVDGAVIFHDPAPAPASTPAVPSTSAHSTQMIDTPTAGSSTAPPAPAVQEDDVDIELYNTPGTIQRQRDEKLCRHNSKGCCVHCSPLEPWDEGYLKEQNIKHLSFHSYLRKMQAKNFIALEEPSFEIKPGCTEHPPWPRGICSKCQPGAVTLNRQVYRHVDNVVLESGALVDRFLGYWRATGRQRVGWLYGRYERHPAVPLGVRARVAAIYEPAQRGTRDHVALLPDDKQPALDAVAARLGLTRLGWIFTDLVPEAAGAGAVRHVRAPAAHPPLSAQEVLTAAHLQNERPSACRHAAAGVFGSKQVTVCVSGDERRQVALEGYQVSAQAAALQRAGLLVPTKDAPELLHVREAEAGAGAGGPGGARYVPDVCFAERDAYGNEVVRAARRLPVEYLLVDVPCGVATAAEPTFADGEASFPPAHREDAGRPQSLALLAAHAARAPSWLAAVSDLHVLLYLATNEALPLGAEAGGPLAALCAAVAARDAAAAEAWRAGPLPATLDQLLRAAAEGGAPASAPAAGAAPWTCPLCTFHNAPHHDACEMCAMPR